MCAVISAGCWFCLKVSFPILVCFLVICAHLFYFFSVKLYYYISIVVFRIW